MFATGETVGLAEWIIDDTWFVAAVAGKLFSIPPEAKKNLFQK